MSIIGFVRPSPPLTYTLLAVIVSHRLISFHVSFIHRFDLSRIRTQLYSQKSSKVIQNSNTWYNE